MLQWKTDEVWCSCKAILSGPIALCSATSQLDRVNYISFQLLHQRIVDFALLVLRVFNRDWNVFWRLLMEALFPKDIEMANHPTLPFEAYAASLSAPKPETTSTFVSIQTSEYSRPIAPRTSRPRQLSQEEWESLKPVLHLLYIQEDKTLEGVRRILRDKHRLFLT